MARYIVDMDALMDCCDFLTIGKFNGQDCTYVQNVKALLDRFPKYEIEETINMTIEHNVKVVGEVTA